MAIERMVSYDNGIIGLPLRLLAREVYDKIVIKKETKYCINNWRRTNNTT